MEAHAWLGFFGEAMLRSSLVLAAAFGLLWLMRRASASERHLVLLLALAAALLVPLGMAVTPKVVLPRMGAVTVVEARWTAMTAPVQAVSAPHPTAASPGKRFDVADGLALLLIGGAVFQLTLFGGALRSLHGVRHRAVSYLLPVGKRGLPPVFLSTEIAVAALAGWWRPVILLPAEAVAWSEERLGMVLSHELAHLRRGDHLAQPFLVLTQAFYWWHPLVRVALVWLRREREQACDDLVLGREFSAADYAQTLVEMAARAGTGRAGMALGLTMASSTRIEGRLRAILNPGLRRKAASPLAFGFALAVALGLLGVLSVCRLEAAPQGGAERPLVKIETKMVEMDEEEYAAHRDKIDDALLKGDILFLVKAFDEMKSDLLSAPTVTVQNGRQVRLDITRTFNYPVAFEKDPKGQWMPSSFDHKEIGVQFELTPVWQDGKIVVSGLARTTAFEGFIQGDTGSSMPVFTTREARLFQVLKDGQSVGMLLPGRRADQRTIHEPNKADQTETKAKRLVILLTATLVNK